MSTLARVYVHGVLHLVPGEVCPGCGFTVPTGDLGARGMCPPCLERGDYYELEDDELEDDERADEERGR